MNTTPYGMGYLMGQVLGGMLCLGVVILFFVALIKSFTKRKAGWIVTASITGVLVLLSGLAMIAVAISGVATALKHNAVKEEGGRTMVSADGRFHITVPGSWTERPLMKSDAVIKAGNPADDEYLLVLVESKQDFAGSLQDYCKAVTGSMAAKSLKADSSEIEPVTVGGWQGLRRTIRATGQNHVNLVYHHTSVETDEVFCQISFWTIASHEAQALPVFEKAAATFSVTAGPTAPVPETPETGKEPR